MRYTISILLLSMTTYHSVFINVRTCPDYQTKEFTALVKLCFICAGIYLYTC